MRDSTLYDFHVLLDDRCAGEELPVAATVFNPHDQRRRTQLGCGSTDLQVALSSGSGV